MRSILSILLLLSLLHSSKELKAQKDEISSMDSIVQFYASASALQFKGLKKPMEGDTAHAIQLFVYLINNDLYQSLYLDPNRNTERGDNAYDYSRTKNYKGLFQYNMYTIYNNRTDGVMRVNYWYTGYNKASLSRSLNVFF